MSEQGVLDPGHCVEDFDNYFLVAALLLRL